MSKRNLIISIIGIIVVLLIVCSFAIYYTKGGVSGFFSGISNMSQFVTGKLSPTDAMEIAKTNGAYKYLEGFAKSFNPEISSYIKLSPSDYATLKPQWQKQGLGARNKYIDNVKLNESTYWIEIKNKNDETRSLQMVVDVQQKKCLFLMAAMTINASVSM